MFSNSTEAMWWQDRNCCRCWKANAGGKYRCKTEMYIEMGYVTGEMPKRTDKITSGADCPYRQAKRPVYKKRVGQSMPLFDFGEGA
jgi:hypothetical protein